MHPPGVSIQAERKGTSTVALQLPFWAIWVYQSAKPQCLFRCIQNDQTVISIFLFLDVVFSIWHEAIARNKKHVHRHDSSEKGKVKECNELNIADCTIFEAGIKSHIKQNLWQSTGGNSG